MTGVQNLAIYRIAGEMEELSNRLYNSKLTKKLVQPELVIFKKLLLNEIFRGRTKKELYDLLKDIDVVHRP